MPNGFGAFDLTELIRQCHFEFETPSTLYDNKNRIGEIVSLRYDTIWLCSPALTVDSSHERADNAVYTLPKRKLAGFLTGTLTDRHQTLLNVR